MLRPPPSSTLFPYTDALPISSFAPVSASASTSLRLSAARSSASVARARSIPDRKSTRLNSSHQIISYAVFCLKKKKIQQDQHKLSQRTSTELSMCKHSHTSLQ